MNVITYTTGILKGDKVWAEIQDRGVTVYRTTEYVTERMAYADAYCWLAFNKGENMDELVTPGEEFEAHRGDNNGGKMTYTAAEVSARIQNAREHGVEVSVRTGANGREYIELHIGGSSYAKYWRMGRPNLGGLSVILAPKAEGGWHVKDRWTGNYLAASVSQEGTTYTLNTTQGPVKGLVSLNSAAELAHARRMA